MATRAHRPWGFPKAPRMPVCRRSAPAHDSILLMRSTWKGCTLQAGMKSVCQQQGLRVTSSHMHLTSQSSAASCKFAEHGAALSSRHDKNAQQAEIGTVSLMMCGGVRTGGRGSEGAVYQWCPCWSLGMLRRW